MNVFGQPAKERDAIEVFHAPFYREPREPGLPLVVNARLEVLDSKIRFVRPRRRSNRPALATDRRDRA
jgi:hypothetical protein